VALSELARMLLPDMVAKRRGKIVLVASTAAFHPGPQMAVYCASKAYLLSFGEAIALRTGKTEVSPSPRCAPVRRTRNSPGSLTSHARRRSRAPLCR
jgi:hypothetical protein